MGQREAGGLLTEAKGRLRHGEWGDWLHRVGLAPRTASTWMKLAGMDLTAEDVIERGGINAPPLGRGKTASEAVLAGKLGRDLAEAEAAIATAKQTYYGCHCCQYFFVQARPLEIVLARGVPQHLVCGTPGILL